MTKLQTWLNEFPEHRFVPLLSIDENGTVETHLRGKAKDRRILTRHPAFDEAVIELVEQGLQEEDWLGLIYIMGVGPREAFIPLYVGKAERRGKSQAVSANLLNLRKNSNHFARWGYNTDYHIGDLSHAMYGFEAYRPPTRKYQDWAQALFTTYDPPMLKEQVSVYLAPWYVGSRGPSGLTGSVPSAEKEIIALASALYGDRLLNRDGR